MIGRKTGKPITLPVNYVRCGDELWVLTLRNRTWWRNIQGSTRVTLCVDGRQLPACAELIADPSCVAARLLEYARLLPAAAGPLGLLQSSTGAETAARLSTERLFVRIRPDLLPTPANEPAA